MNENDQLDVGVEALSDAWISVLTKVGDGDGYPSYPLELRPGSGHGTVSIAFQPREAFLEVSTYELRFGLDQVKKRKLPSWPGIYAEPVEVPAPTTFEERPLQITEGTDKGRICLRLDDGMPGRELALADLEQALDMLPGLASAA